ncbi:AAA family ATPase [Mixta theicola]|uniref:AAA family ATPase n=1 Tax=Mixta theicola TaxID=1458355 RepID=A0A2K1QF96_9GAMM|nr:AAA family ATPase [Mixta theicola]PNS13702.1 AAA family ATPase [Mixta theicola]GLR09632.1 serine transporter [Mixta theicola]
MKQQGWKLQDTIWTLGLYGTTVGAGTLFLPIEIGTRGPVIFIIMLLLGLPLSLLPHLVLCRVYMSETTPQRLPALSSWFGPRGDWLMTLLYCVAFYPVMLVYGISLVNALDNFLVGHLHFARINKGILTLLCMVILFGILSKGRSKVVGTLGTLALPFAVAIIAIAAVQIPEWRWSNVTDALNALPDAAAGTTFKNIWLTLPLITFSFCCAPIISPLTAHYQGSPDKLRVYRVIKVAYLAIFISIIFFVFSCILSIPHATFVEAKEKNLNVLSVISAPGSAGVLFYIAPFIAIIGMTKSFLGVSLSVTETFSDFTVRLFNCRSDKSRKISQAAAMLVMYGVTSLIVYANPNVITLIEAFCGPLIAIILFLIPAWLIYNQPSLAFLRGGKALMIVTGGIATLSALLYSMM